MFRELSALIAVLVASLALTACGGDDAPDTDGELSASELAAMLPDGGMPQATAVDVSAAKEAAGLPADLEPTTVGFAPAELRFAQSTFYALRELSLLTDNPVRAALDHSAITAYAAHPYVSDEAVALVSTSQDFGEIAESLEADGWERDGDVVSTEGNPDELGYTAVAAGDGSLVLGTSPEGVEAAASGSAEPSKTGELVALGKLDAPVVFAMIPDAEDLECVSLITFEDFVDGRMDVHLTVEGKADDNRVPSELSRDIVTIGFEVDSTEVNGDVVTLHLTGREDENIANSPALVVYSGLDDAGPLLYTCE